ncbi:MAG: hypothetical protein C0501_15625 [Isosphaera sp.]|nr:hypothetical protein [Isosphaera sp.]
MAAQILPAVKLFFPCERLGYDAAEARYQIEGPIHSVALGAADAFPFVWDEFFCYAQLTDGIGTFRFAAELLAEEADVALRRSPPVEVTFPPALRLAVHEVAFRLTEARFPGPGLYRLPLLCNHRPLPGTDATIRFL